MKTSSKKRLVLIVALVVLATLLLPASALAAGHGYRGNGRMVSRNVQYDQCPYADCDLAYVHEHDGTYYCDNYAMGGGYGMRGSSRRGGCCGW